MYVAEQDQNPFGSVLAIYLAAEGDGSLVKLAGHVSANPATGQLTTTFSETPDLPFSSLKLDLWSGPRAALVTPEACGSYSSEASFQAWAGLAPVDVSDRFEITAGCAPGFAPAFTAGTYERPGGSVRAVRPVVLEERWGTGTLGADGQHAARVAREPLKRPGVLGRSGRRG